jgi:RimJ/RimL family protein N-acetyltransferase
MQDTSKNAVIRSVLPEDVHALRELRLEALRLHPTDFWQDHDQDASLPLDYWQDQIQRAQSSANELILVAESNGTLIGMTAISRTNFIKHDHAGLIWGVYVRPQWRGQHIPDQLIGGCLDWARRQRLRIVKLSVTATNGAAVRLYLRCGFSVYGVDPDITCVNGVYYDELMMARRL